MGLPTNTVGNSEVGHMTIGAGRIIEQGLLRINNAYKSGVFQTRMNILQENFSKRVHLIGLLSDGSVHSHIDHVKFLQKSISHKIKIFVHAIADGRDTGPREFSKFFDIIDNVVSVAGRFYTMDRDNNFDRINEAFTMMTDGTEVGYDPEMLYDNGNTDEFIKPVLLKEEGKIRENDTLVFFNFRADRMRQIVKCFRNYKRIYTMVDYGIGIGTVILEQINVFNTLPEWIDKNHIEQTHIAETEKYAHVTYFFNGGKEDKYRLETRVMVPSPKVESFAEVPETSMSLVTEKCIKSIRESTGFIVANLAGPDLVGHTGDYEKAIESVKKMDGFIRKIYQECSANGYILVITADHGNSEVMIDEKGPVTKHTTNKVPLIITKPGILKKTKNEESLADIAPTICGLLGLEVPDEMTGRSLLE